MHLCASLLCIMCHPYVPAFYSHLMLGCACTCNLKSFRHRCLEAIAVQSSFWLWLCCPVPTQRTEMSGGGRPRGSVGPKKRQQEADSDDPTGSKRAARKEHFFDPHFYVAHGSTASVCSPDVEKCDAVPGTTVNAGTLAATAPPLPDQALDDIAELPQRRSDSADNTLYTY